MPNDEDLLARVAPVTEPSDIPDGPDDADYLCDDLEEGPQ